jgi:hypothetical protein
MSAPREKDSPAAQKRAGSGGAPGDGAAAPSSGLRWRGAGLLQPRGSSERGRRARRGARCLLPCCPRRPSPLSPSPAGDAEEALGAVARGLQHGRGRGVGRVGRGAGAFVALRVGAEDGPAECAGWQRRTGGGAGSVSGSGSGCRRGLGPRGWA